VQFGAACAMAVASLIRMPAIRPCMLVLLVLSTLPEAGAQNVLTYHNDNARTGQNLAETILNTSNVNVSTFGKLFVLAADGKVDAEPLYLGDVTIGSSRHNVVYVATENDSVYAYDADTGTLLWHVSALASGETASDNRNCGQVTPTIGITSTPVIDPSSGPHGTIYVVAMSKDSKGSYHQRLHALDVTTGAEEFKGPVAISATYPGTGAEGNGTTLTFNPAQHKERAGLLLLNGVIYLGWSSHCDIAPYNGWVMGYDESSLVQTQLLNFTPNGNDGSVWQSGAGMAADSSGNIYFLAANGTADTAVNGQGFPVSGDYGNAFLKLSTGGSLAVADYFNEYNTVTESNSDEDLGSGGALVLPDMTDAGNKIWQLAVGAGKDRNIYLVNRANLGKYNGSTNNIYQQLTTPLAGGEFGMAAYFDGAIYYGSVGDNLKRFAFVDAKLQATPSSKTNITFPSPGATPSISADGGANGIVWATENTSPAVLHAYEAANLATELYNSNQAANGRDQFGTGNKFITPMIANGKVYVGTTTGVGVFGLLPSSPGVSLSSTSLTFSDQLEDTTSAAQTVTLTNTGAASISISKIAATGNFAVSTGTNACGSALAGGLNCLIYVTFTPTASGSLTGTLSITDNASGSPQSVSLKGTGTAFSVSSSPSSRSISASGSSSFTLTVAPQSGFTGSVAVSCSGAPATMTCTLSPASVSLSGSSKTSTATVKTTKTPNGTYKLTLTGRDGSLSKSTTVSVKVP